MRRFFRLGIPAGLFAVCLLSGMCFSEASAAARYNIILISWDGAQRNHVNEMLQSGKLPNLAKLAVDGRLIPLRITTHGTDTKAGHTQMLTGYKPDVTGVHGDLKYGPVPEGLSVFERLENSLGPSNIVTMMVTGKSHNLGSIPEGVYSIAPGKPEEWHPAEPWFNARRHIDVWYGDKIRNATTVYTLAAESLDKYSRNLFFLFMHFHEPDSSGHMFGENTNDYSNALNLLDTQLGKIRAKLKSLGIADDTLIYVTADHGFDEGAKSHGRSPDIWLATNDTALTAGSGDQMDIVPTLLKRMGFDPSTARPPLPGKPLF